MYGEHTRWTTSLKNWSGQLFSLFHLLDGCSMGSFTASPETKKWDETTLRRSQRLRPGSVCGLAFCFGGAQVWRVGGREDETLFLARGDVRVAFRYDRACASCR